MKRNWAIPFVCVLLTACAAKPVYKTECPAAVPEAAQTENTVPDLQPAEAPKADTIQKRTDAVPSTQEFTGETAGEQGLSQPDENNSQQITADAPRETIQERISAARGRQTLTAPAPDKPSFKNEEIIPLEGRRFSPLAYEPVRAAADKSAPWAGEALKYGLYYSFIKAGTAYIKTRGISTVGGRDAYLIQTTAFSASAIDPFFKVRDVNYSWLDAENFSSLGYAQSVREGNYKRDEWLTFDYDNNLFYGEVQKKAEPRVISGELDIPVLDMLTSLYFVRAQELTPGKDVVFDIVNREKQYPLVVKVLRKETVKTAAGKFDCIVVEPQFRGEGIFVSKGKSLQVWLTDDEYKMPVKMKTEVFIGSVSAELLEYKRN